MSVLLRLTAPLVAGLVLAATPTAAGKLPSKPPARTQVQKSKAERGGVSPCNSPDPGFGAYRRWDRAPSLGQMIVPEAPFVRRDGRFDVVVHFHGHEPIRKEWVQAMKTPVLVGIDLGIGSGAYTNAFRVAATFERLLESVEKGVAKATGREDARVGRIALSAWSAGYGAIQQILTQPVAQRIDAVFVLDGMHTGYLGGKLDEAQLKPFVGYARKAAAGQRLMFISHSSIIPPGYASSTETARHLVRALGGEPRTAKPRKGDPWGLDLNSRYDRGGLHVRGYDGNDKPDHCAHIGLFRDVLSVHLAKRWAKGGAPIGAPKKARERVRQPSKVRKRPRG